MLVVSPIMKACTLLVSGTTKIRNLLAETCSPQLLAVLFLAGVVISGCRAEDSDLQMVYAPIEGDQAIISRFEGAWYAYDELQIVIQISPIPRLGVLLWAGYGISNAHTVPRGIRFDLENDGDSKPLVLQFVTDDAVLALLPDQSPEAARYYDPLLVRSPWYTRALITCGREIAEAPETVMSLLIDAANKIGV